MPQLIEKLGKIIAVCFQKQIYMNLGENRSNCAIHAKTPAIVQIPKC